MNLARPADFWPASGYWFGTMNIALPSKYGLTDTNCSCRLSLHCQMNLALPDESCSARWILLCQMILALPDESRPLGWLLFCQLPLALPPSYRLPPAFYFFRTRFSVTDPAPSPSLPHPSPT